MNIFKKKALSVAILAGLGFGHTQGAKANNFAVSPSESTHSRVTATTLKATSVPTSVVKGLAEDIVLLMSTTGIAATAGARIAANFGVSTPGIVACAAAATVANFIGLTYKDECKEESIKNKIWGTLILSGFAGSIIGTGLLVGDSITWVYNSVSAESMVRFVEQVAFTCYNSPTV